MPDAQDAEPPEFYLVALGEHLGHAGEDGLDDPLSVLLAEA